MGPNLHSNRTCQVNLNSFGSAGDDVKLESSERDFDSHHQASAQSSPLFPSLPELVLRTKFGPFGLLLNGDCKLLAPFTRHSRFVQESLRSVLEDEFYEPSNGCCLRERVAKEILGRLY